MAILLSTLPEHLIWEGQSDVVDRTFIRSIVQHIRSMFKITPYKRNDLPKISSRHPLLRAFKKKSCNEVQATQLIASLLRAVGVSCRYCIAIEPSPLKISVKDIITNEKIKKENQTIVIDHDDEPAQVNVINQQDPIRKIWLEFYSTSENRWATLDPFNEKNKEKIVFDDPRMLVDNKKPFSYVIASEGDYMKDVTKRYSLRWSVTRQQRIPDEAWLFRIFRSYSMGAFQTRGEEWKRREMEDEKMLKVCEEIEEFPTSMEGFRRHPFYTLEKFITKYQMLLPGAAPVGEFKNIPVFRRDDIQDLHSPDKWLQDGRVIKEGEEPLKRVPKKKVNRDDEPKKQDKTEKKSNNSVSNNNNDHTIVAFNDSIDNVEDAFRFDDITNEEINEAMDAMDEVEGSNEPMSNLYSYAQTEPYQPGEAKDGIVPKNSYGNVYVFKPEMLPKGTVHVKLPALGKLCKSLGIDYAPAMVAWDTKMGRSVPSLDGYVVCQEQSELLIEAWNQIEAKAAEDRQKRKEKLIYGRWRKLIRGMLSREEVREKYGDGTEEETDQNLTVLQSIGNSEFSNFETIETEDKKEEESEEELGLISSNKKGLQRLKKSEQTPSKTVQKTKASTKKLKGGPHVHSFTNERMIDKNGLWERRCECGFTLEFEKL
eukprot:TRINITY_DN8903_c0_g1_i1.p1 TRINITY_DN8903_c0_g1~~TRINITY_DN8903_c0_g1_i1.p1  ORF type:complete len:652 (-),score=209.62 TRINITY_DN8903_c0_g1_i1:71-2026(-)